MWGPCVSADVPPLTQGVWYRPGVESTWQWQLQGSIMQCYP